jgi:hypothetical protein
MARENRGHSDSNRHRIRFGDPNRAGKTCEQFNHSNSHNYQPGRSKRATRHSGTVTATIKGKTSTTPFTVPVNISLAADQSAATDCPVLGPINLDLLGLVVETSPICLQIVAHPGDGLLGDLLCAVGNLLNGGLSLDQILGGQGLLDSLGVTLLPGSQ